MRPSIISAIVLIIVIVGGALWVSRRHEAVSLPFVPTETESEASVSKRPPFKEPRSAPAGFAEYRSVFYRFQLLYPDTLKIMEYPVPVSAMTLTFTSPDTSQQFQIFIVPHGDPHITEYRIAQDLSSGVMEDVQEVEVGGAKGIAFRSRDAIIGDTREVWFVQNGFLYEVTAPLALDAWLAEIMQGWEFL